MSDIQTRFEKVSLEGGLYDGLLQVIRSDCARMSYKNIHRRVRHRCVDGKERLFPTEITYVRTDEHARNGLTIFRHEP